MKDQLAMIPSVGCLLLGLSGWTVAAESPFHDMPDSPRSLPADNLPPFRMLDANGNLVPLPAMPPGGLHRSANAPPESSAPGPSMPLEQPSNPAAARAIGLAWP
jgi:hypothetical protein